jgi:hypothetical protein
VTYQPKPLDTAHIIVDESLMELIELLARNNHENWAKQRIDDGWTVGKQRDDEKREHPGLIPYEELPETEKKYDRITSLEIIKTIIALGYSIRKLT